MGGLHDYIDTLTDLEIAEYILKKADEHRALNTKDFLNGLVQEYNLSINDVHHKRKETKLPLGGGLEGILYRCDRPTLESWALSAERYSRIQKGFPRLFGGLHDYIDSLSNEELVEFIYSQVKAYPELNSTGFLSSLVQEYQIGDTTHQTAVTLSSLLEGVSREQLSLWALATEAYHRNVLGVRLMGGLHDYISRLSEKEIVDYIVKKSEEHREINSLEMLNQLVEKFNINNADHGPQTA